MEMRRSQLLRICDQSNSIVQIPMANNILHKAIKPLAEPFNLNDEQVDGQTNEIIGVYIQAAANESRRNRRAMPIGWYIQ